MQTKEELEAESLKKLRERIAQRPSRKGNGSNVLTAFVVLGLLALFLYYNAQNSPPSDPTDMTPRTPQAREEAKKWETVKKVQQEWRAEEAKVEEERARRLQMQRNAEAAGAAAN
ncbi:hypothetical protein [Hydrogenophaga sp. 2FB]|uniref:hypothetical protein n=1 Tax=Hydrogenophaga sp. 2FB TaxID=2502187 RepID=UPI0010F69359|nr:hypothetical protein [Hydrogenophaga sp. 2FB]